MDVFGKAPAFFSAAMVMAVAVAEGGWRSRYVFYNICIAVVCWPLAPKDVRLL